MCDADCLKIDAIATLTSPLSVILYTQCGHELEGFGRIASCFSKFLVI
jgi:hypothetical protein